MTHYITTSQCETYLLQAFKKLKSNLFYDKTQAIARERVVLFEGESDSVPGTSFRKRIAELADALTDADSAKWDQVVESVCSNVSALPFPKQCASDSRAPKDTSDGKPSFIASRMHASPVVDRIQFFIDMQAEGFLLGTLWVMLVGVKLDASFADCCYGNRICKTAKEKGACTYSPKLFEPYFSQYEKWRDGALDMAQRTHDDDKVDVLIVSLDFKSFYYTVDISDSDWRRIAEATFAEGADADSIRRESGGAYTRVAAIEERLSDFVRRVIAAYSRKLPVAGGEGRNILPIGFPPSPILANWCLGKFDAAVNEQINPLFYGRYVDDVMLVIKVESNSPLRQYWKEGLLDAEKVFARLFCERKDPFFLSDDETASMERDANHEGSGPQSSIEKDAPAEKVVNNCYLDAQGSRVSVQDKKVKVFYFDKDAPAALLEQFRARIAENSSEFRDMPNIDGFELKDSYSVLFSLDSGDSPNRFREVEGIKLNAYELSKFLGCCERVGCILDLRSGDFVRFAEELVGLYEPIDTIERYTTWEKLIEVAVCLKAYGTAEKMLKRMVEAIGKVKLAGEIKDDVTARYVEGQGNPEALRALKGALLRFLRSCFARAFGLAWGGAADAVAARAQGVLEDLNSAGTLGPSSGQQNQYAAYGKESPGLYGVDYLRRLYCETYMVDKYAMPVLPQLVIPRLLQLVGRELDAERNLTSFDDVCRLLPCERDDDLWGYEPEGLSDLFPYTVKKNDLEFSLYTHQLPSGSSLALPVDVHNRVNELYASMNKWEWDDGKTRSIGEPTVFKPPANMGDLVSAVVSVPAGDERLGKLRVGICSIPLSEEMLESLFKGSPDRSFGRYSRLVEITRASRREHVDVLVLPECCVPYSWLPRLVSFSARNGIAIVCGIETLALNPIGGEPSARNLTAIVLPYKQDDYLFAKLVLHEKTHMSPHEIELVSNYGYKPCEGKNYELYHWKDTWFPVYCCFELASIRDRAIFSEYADAVFAVEWNKDRNYYSHIVGSLARDLACCCVQVNNAKYGDSRITMPDKTERMDLVSVRGGKNPVLIVGEIDIDSIRTSQLRQDGKPLKPPPPGFDHDVARKKMLGILLEELEKGSRDH